MDNNFLSPNDYEKVAVIRQEVAEALLTRLDWMTIKPDRIGLVGCKTGFLGGEISKRYPKAHISVMTPSIEYQFHIQSQFPALEVLIDAAPTLPFANQSIDLLIAHFVMPWSNQVEALLKEWRRVLRPQGMLMITALGVDTLTEWRHIAPDNIVPQCVDMHEIGDAFIRAGLVDPVLDVDYYTMTYQHQQTMLDELIATEMMQDHALLAQQIDQLPRHNEVWELTYEIIHAHAFAPDQGKGASPSADGIVRIPLSYLRRR